MVTHSELLKLVHYDPKTGIFLLKENTTKRLAGSIMNCNWFAKNRPHAPRNIRRTTVNIRRTCYPAGRLAWFYMTGEWPVGEVIHMDHDGWNLRWDNLRDATYSQKKARSRPKRLSKCGRKGVTFDGRRGSRPWRADIKCGNTFIRIGSFASADEANAAYAKYAAVLHGEFANP